MSIWPAGTVCRATVRGVPEKFGMWECNGYFFTPLAAEPIVSLPAGQRSALAKLPNPVREEE